MKNYVDGFVIVLAKDKVEAYREIAEKAAVVWKEHGALEYRECIGDDMEIAGILPFPKLTGAGPDETVVFSWIAYESREHRDAVNAKVMADPRMNEMSDGGNMPFDIAKMAYGGFRTIVAA